jgi:hypothetical protein
MDQTVDMFFAEFVDKILIRDWTKILSQNNPWRSRHQSDSRAQAPRRWLVQPDRRGCSRSTDGKTGPGASD